jgi:hypothetical protein
MQLVFSGQEAALARAVEEIERKIRAAEAAAVQDAAKLAVKEGQANVAAAGFSLRRQKGKVKYLFYSNVGSDPAAIIYFPMPFAYVFEKGVRIKGRPLLWLPIEKNLPAGIHSPSQYGKKLVSVNVAGKPPLLFDATNRLLGPLFFGTKSATIKKRLNLKAIFARAQERMKEFYEQRIKELDGND